MFNGFRLILIIIVILAFGLLSVFAFLKFNQAEEEIRQTDERADKVVYLVEGASQFLINFLNFLSSPNWLSKSDQSIVEESIGDLEFIDKPIDDLVDIKNINLRQVINDSYRVTNWRLLWHEYWQKQAGWLSQEWDRLINK